MIDMEFFICDLWENEGLHCGEGVEVLVEDKWVPSRMEMAWTEKETIGIW